MGCKNSISSAGMKGDVTHFLLITFWDSMESVKKFAGEHPEKAKYYPEDDDFLLEKEETSVMYEIFYEAVESINRARSISTA